MNARALLSLVPLALAACHHGAPAAVEPATAAAPGEVRLEQVPEFVRVEEAVAGGEAGSVAATGRVAFDEEAVSRVASPVSGRVVELLARPGDRVRRGAPLLAIASPDAEAAIADDVAAVADQEEAARALARLKRLHADGAAALKDVLQAESDLKKADAGVARSRGKLAVLGIDPARKDARLARFVLRAPIDGVVVERPAFPGMEVRADSGTPLVTVADLRTLWVLADVYERDLGRVARGQRATVRVAAWPDRAFEGALTHVGDLVDPQTRTVKLRIEVRNPKGELKPEMFARVALEALPAHASSVTVPAGAVLSDGEGSAVIVDVGGGRFQKRTVESGSESEGRVPLLAGVRPGERVVVGGALFLKSAIEGT